MTNPPDFGATSPSSTGTVDAAVDTLRSRLPGLLSRVDTSDQHRLLSITIGLPELDICNVPELLAGTVYWSRPDAQEVTCGRGYAFELATSGQNRFAALGRQFAELSARWLRIQSGRPLSTPRLMLAISFEPDHDESGSDSTRAHLPEVVFEQRGSQAFMTFSSALPMEPGADHRAERWLDTAESLLTGLTRKEPMVGEVQRLQQLAGSPSRESWLKRVEQARSVIRNGAFSKVVLSRRLRVQAPRPFYAPRVVNWLQQHYPSCAHLAFAGPEGTLISASPEELVSLHEGRVRSDALASTTVRSPDPAEDAYLEQELLANPKARKEHVVVVDAIIEALRPLCRRMKIPPEPRIMKLETLQHLWTPIEGMVKPNTTLLDCVERLHPTPAVGGYPREPALDWLAAHGERRGWFTGGIGWMSPTGDGELAVVLRCAMLQAREAEVFAGAGIVGDSDPQAELGETELKMRVILEALARASTEP